MLVPAPDFTAKVRKSSIRGDFGLIRVTGAENQLWLLSGLAIQSYR